MASARAKRRSRSVRKHFFDQTLINLFVIS
jgi:hypothetical protein